VADREGCSHRAGTDAGAEPAVELPGVLAGGLSAGRDLRCPAAPSRRRLWSTAGTDSGGEGAVPGLLRTRGPQSQLRCRTDDGPASRCRHRTGLGISAGVRELPGCGGSAGTIRGGGQFVGAGADDRAADRGHPGCRIPSGAGARYLLAADLAAYAGRPGFAAAVCR